ncbi:uncharacterized protein LOC114537111 isoform X2 [Dendronephthya gigantea]|uniref:uncharacterized protein LOC114537111 isoform X2 n=1 Tax=Dendronephthya gigantea TaxID=151771 RepID=UPI00106D26CB|nr:uncharacterized protein LOC114537111 isoform X2 [Dendronephthya gigantea]
MDDHDERMEADTAALDDLKLLIESIKYRHEDLEFQEQALKTMASIFRTSDNTSSFLVHTNGLEHILKILISPDDQPNSLREASLHAMCAACENNASVRQVLCTQKIFCVLKKFLLMKSSIRLQTLSSYLLICLIKNNEKGQNLARQTKCVETLRYLFKDVRSPSHSPRLPNRLAEYLSSNCQENEALMNLWQTATHALSVCVYNPQNNGNQFLCSSAFPAAVAYLRNSDYPRIQTSTLTFLTNCLVNNSRCKVNFRLVGGIRVLYDIFREDLLAGGQIPSTVLQILILTIDAAVRDNDMCRDSIAEMEIVPLLLQSLQLCFASPKFKIQCLITLSACIEGCDSSCKQFLTNDGMPTVVKVLAENQNCEELQKSAVCVLQTYLEQTKITIPECMDDVLTKLQIAPDNKLQVERKQNIAGEVHVTNVENGSSNGCESNVFIENIDKMPTGQTDMIVNRIQDLTNEVRSLKELCAFTVEQKSVSDNRIDRLMDMMNTTTRSGVIFSNKDVDSNKVDTSVSETGATCDEMKKKLDSTDSNSIDDSPCNQIVSEDMQGEKIQNGDVVGLSEQSEASMASESPLPHPIGNSIKAGPVTDSNEQIPIQSNTFDCTVDHNQDYPIVEDLKTNPDPNSEIIPSQKELDVDTIRSSSDVCSETCKCNGDSNCEKVANIRCGETPKNQKTEMINSRASKRPFITTANEKRNNEKGLKRRLRMSESDHEDSPSPGQEIPSESPVDKSVDVDIPVHDVILKAPFPPRKKRKEPLLFERNKKGICRKCLGCRVDFAKVNSRNYLSSIRRSINTCTEHRLFFMEVVSALQRYKKFKETKKRSPDFDFVSSPKVNVRCEGFPREIAKRVKPDEQRNSSRPTKKPFTAREIEILKEGVDKYGPRFNIIEKYCEFSTKRSAKTLKQKYTSLMQATCYKPKKRCPFTLQEEENLKEGVSKYGFQWKKILNHYSFMPQRTPQNLKDKWRNMLK